MISNCCPQGKEIILIILTFKKPDVSRFTKPNTLLHRNHPPDPLRRAQESLQQTQGETYAAAHSNFGDRRFISDTADERGRGIPKLELAQVSGIHS